MLSTNAGVFIEAAPPDLKVDEGGFADFQRSYDPGTAVMLTAPRGDNGLAFAAWEWNGVRVPGIPGPDSVSVDVTMLGSLETIRAIYQKPVQPSYPRPTPTPEPEPTPMTSPSPLIR